jgi:hypothetical protein
MHAYGIDIPTLFCFLLVNIISFIWANSFIQAMCKSVKEIRPANYDALEMNFGRLIVSLERIIYIYAIMSHALEILTAWVILKLFFGWIEHPKFPSANKLSSFHEEVPADGKEVELSSMAEYYHYIYGNGLSLITAIALAHLAVTLSLVVKSIKY